MRNSQRQFTIYDLRKKYNLSYNEYSNRQVLVQFYNLEKSKSAKKSKN